VLTDHRNTTSDLDIVVIGVDDAPYRETLVDLGFTIEVFAHTLESLGAYWRRDAARRTTHLAGMVGEGAVLISVDQLAEQLQRKRAPSSPKALLRSTRRSCSSCDTD
jgi:hypothetical protein